MPKSFLVKKNHHIKQCLSTLELLAQCSSTVPPAAISPAAISPSAKRIDQLSSSNDDNIPYDLSTKSPERKELKQQKSPPPASPAPVIRPYPLSPHNMNIPYHHQYVWSPHPHPQSGPLYGIPYQISLQTPYHHHHHHHMGALPQLQTENRKRMIPAEVPIGYSAAYPVVNADSRSGSPEMRPIPSPLSSGESDSSTNVGLSSKKQRKPKDLSKLECNACGKSYSTFSGLNKHKSGQCNSHVKKSFPCKECDKVYITLGALKMHIRTHTLPCKCKFCGKAFSRPWLLQGHIRTHTGEKPFKCTHCDRAFADRSNLRAHLQTHSEVKKYRCNNCSKTFSRMSLLNKHDDSNCPGVVSR